ncbi:hypothetical protein QRE66_06190 [Bacillus cereus]|nr:hypothetical protein QRE66_06190 [Bacillus cereus]
MKKEEEQHTLNTSEFKLSHFNSSAGTNIILEIMKLAGIDLSEDNLDLEESNKIDITTLILFLLSTPTILRKLDSFLKENGIEFLVSSSDTFSSQNSTNEQTFNLELTPSSVNNFIHLIQTLELDDKEITLQLTKLQEVLNLLNSPSSLPSDMENN